MNKTRVFVFLLCSLLFARDVSAEVVTITQQVVRDKEELIRESYNLFMRLKTLGFDRKNPMANNMSLETFFTRSQKLVRDFKEMQQKVAPYRSDKTFHLISRVFGFYAMYLDVFERAYRKNPAKFNHQVILGLRNSFHEGLTDPCVSMYEAESFLDSRKSQFSRWSKWLQTTNPSELDSLIMQAGSEIFTSYINELRKLFEFSEVNRSKRIEEIKEEYISNLFNVFTLLTEVIEVKHGVMFDEEFEAAMVKMLDSM